MVIKPVEQLLSPMTKNRLDTRPMDKNDRILLDQIRQQKVDLLS
jgi:hypothetical protein